MHPDMPSIIPAPPTELRPSTPNTPPHVTPSNNPQRNIPTINIGMSRYPVIIKNNTAYIRAKNLEMQINSLNSSISSRLKNIILESIPLCYAPPSQIPFLNPRPTDNEFVVIVRVEDAIRAINLTQQFSNIFNGIQLFSSQTGILTISYKGLSVTTSYIFIRNDRYIPTDTLSHLNLPYLTTLQTLTIQDWERTQLLLQHHSSPQISYPQPLPDPLLVTNLEHLPAQYGFYLEIEHN